jgi:hypothetical protein
MPQPWCSGLDFDRGAYVASLPKGEETVLDDLESARKKVEQVCLLRLKQRVKHGMKRGQIRIWK